MISLAYSLITNEVRKNVNTCLDENRLSQGGFIKEFEDKVAKYIGAKHAMAVCNGTMADIVALAALRQRNPFKTEVIVPALTFVAQTNSVLINGLTPVFVDIGEDLQIDINKIKEKITRNTLAIFPVHLLGKECNIEAIKQFNLPVIEDCCEAFGVWEKSEFGTYSFFPSHTITTGEGGMIITNDDLLAEFARKIMNHGRRSDNILEKFHFDFLGYNGKMSNVLASIGSALMPLADEIIEQRKRNVEIYNQIIGGDWYAVSPHAYPYFYRNSKLRDETLIRLEENGIEARKLFSCLPTKEYGLKGDYPIAEEVGGNGLFLPIHQGLTLEDIKKVTLLL